MTLFSNAANQEINLSPEEREERDKALCPLLKYSFQCMLHVNIPLGDKLCEAIKEREKPDEQNQRKLYDFILKHLQEIKFDTGY